jgi:SAM-dependent methyltransferase
MSEFIFRLHSEMNIDNFSALDGTVKFYNFVRAAMLKVHAREVLDYGAGRGGFWHEDCSHYRKHMRDLRTKGAVVTACDIDQAVLAHPCSQRQIVIKDNERLPFEDEAFDVIVSDMTFEHIDNPGPTSKELLRVLKRGGYICARTPNRFGYVRIMAQLIPNRFHVRLLRQAQVGRKAEDVFPTRYKLNSLAQVRNSFKGCAVYHYYDNAEPSYYFASDIVYRLFHAFHKITPGFLSTSICLFIRKPVLPFDDIAKRCRRIKRDYQGLRGKSGFGISKAENGAAKSDKGMHDEMRRLLRVALAFIHRT